SHWCKNRKTNRATSLYSIKKPWPNVSWHDLERILDHASDRRCLKVGVGRSGSPVHGPVSPTLGDRRARRPSGSSSRVPSHPNHLGRHADIHTRLVSSRS